MTCVLGGDRRGEANGLEGGRGLLREGDNEKGRNLLRGQREKNATTACLSSSEVVSWFPSSPRWVKN